MIAKGTDLIIRIMMCDSKSHGLSGELAYVFKSRKCTDAHNIPHRLAFKSPVTIPKGRH